jgi:hypothetical protein
LTKVSSQVSQAQKNANFVGDQVTVMEKDWGHGKFTRFKTLMERMDKQDSLIQDLREEVAILKGERCRCFDAGSGSSGMADVELEYAGDEV